MGLRINTNISSLASQRALQHTTHDQDKAYRRLASGERIVSAADDAAGLAISESLKAQIRSIGQAERNANDSVSLVQVAEGGISEITNILTRLRELSIQAASDTVGPRERTFINQEFQALIKEADRISEVTTFNGVHLLNGSAERGVLEFQVGIYNVEPDRIQFDPTEHDLRADTIGLSNLNALTIDDAREAIDVVDEGLAKAGETRAKLGATQNKLQATINNLGIYKENLSQARSRMADADVAEETSNLVKQNILASAGVAVLSQANQAPLQALKLL